MTHNEAASLIETMLNSMKQNPAQFNFNVSVTTVGAMGIGGSGGHGIVGIANGPGVGVYASASSPTAAQIEIAQQSANSELNAQFQVIQSVLENIVSELRFQTISAQKKETFLAQLKKTWLPNVLVTLISSIITNALGA